MDFKTINLDRTELQSYLKMAQFNSLTTFSIMTFSKLDPSLTAVSIMTFSILTFSKRTLSIWTLSITKRKCDT
jgi:hypothetical protein